MQNKFKEIFEVSASIRYVAIYCGNELISQQKEDLKNSSSSESDKYEELFVNPTILKIANQRGNLDCGGLDYITLSYGNFQQLIFNYLDGHISICIDKNTNANDLYEPIKNIISFQ